MQIHEITQKNLNEAAPGSFAAKAGVFGSALGKSLLQKINPSMNLSAPGGTVAVDPQAQAKLMAQPVIQDLAKKQAGLWNQITTDLLSKNNVVDVNDIPPAVRKDALLQQVNSKMLATMSGNQITDYQDLTDKLRSADAATNKSANDLIRNINASIDVILATEPVKQNTAKMVAAWNNLVANVYTAANMVKFNSPVEPAVAAKTGVKVPTGQRLKVVSGNADYYKTPQGTWTNAMGTKISNPTQVSFLEKLAGQTAAKLERV